MAVIILDHLAPSIFHDGTRISSRTAAAGKLAILFVRPSKKIFLQPEVIRMFDVWKITIRPKADIYLEDQGPSAISLLAWRERGNERCALVLKNNGCLREVFTKLFSVNTADEIVDALMMNRIVNIPGSFTTRQLNSLGFRL